VTLADGTLHASSAPRDYQSRLFAWSERMTPRTGSPSGTATSLPSLRTLSRARVDRVVQVGRSYNESARQGARRRRLRTTSTNAYRERVRSVRAVIYLGGIVQRIIRCLAVVLVFALMSVSLAGCGSGSKADNGGSPVSSSTGDSTSPDEKVSAEFPPAPADVSGMQGWLAEAYPDAAWVTRIKSIEYVSGEVPDSGGFGNAIVVTTDLDFASEQALADQISAALGEAHPTWAKQFIVRYADGNNITAGDIWDRTP
jgi:hypothetical protein